jgi:hypothetical protein
MQAYLSIPGHLPVREFAARVQRSPERVLQFVRDGRLPCCVVGGRYMIPTAALASFKPAPHGKIRTHAVRWRRYRTCRVCLWRLEVPIVPGQETVLAARLLAMAERQEYLFEGTMTRIVSIEDGVLFLLLVWKTIEAEERALAQEMERFKAALADDVEWNSARASRSEALAHT